MSDNEHSWGDPGFRSMILCPDTEAGELALHEAIQEGWDVVCQWREPQNDPEKGLYWTNHIALRLWSEDRNAA